jgi:hypothetical protein
MKAKQESGVSAKETTKRRRRSSSSMQKGEKRKRKRKEGVHFIRRSGRSSRHRSVTR